MKTISKRVLSVFLALAMMLVLVPPNLLTVDATLLPLEEETVYLNLNNYTEEELKHLPLEDVLNQLEHKNGEKVEIPKSAKVVWTYYKDETGNVINDEYHVIGNSETVDMSLFGNRTGYEMELIIGLGKQLDTASKRYIVKVYITGKYAENIEVEFSALNSNNERTIIEPLRGQCVVSDSPDVKVISPTTGEEKYMTAWNCFYEFDENSYVSPRFGLSSDLVDNPHIDIKIYERSSYDKNPSASPDLFDQLFYQDMTKNDSGYAINPSLSGYSISRFYMFYYVEGVQKDVYQLVVRFGGKASQIEGEMFTLDENNNKVSVVETNYVDLDLKNQIDTYRYVVLPNYSESDSLLFHMDLNAALYGNVNRYVTKIVKGHFDSLDDASDEPDIKDLILNADKGYASDYSGEGVKFTIFIPEGYYGEGQSVYKIIVKTENSDNQWVNYTDKPIVGAKDPWVRITGAVDNNGSQYDSYVIENGKAINMDTYYGYGYQTIFVKDDIDLSNVKPVFWRADTERVTDFYEVSEDASVKIGDIDSHTRNFTEANKEYTVKIDGNEKNYWVTYKKLNNNGPELYVFGPSNREVLLNEYFEEKHDILIANVGNAPLTNIKVELDATNVKLDDYWTVGGSGNNTLAPFSTTSTDKQYGELPNLAKIRLVKPSADEITGDGTIEGTLTISADGQEPVVITLNGNVQQPTIVNKKIPDAVKYVPYSSIVATNNFHEWIDTEFELVSGALPTGVEFISSTGEIYGVPTETGTFTFTIAAKYLVDGQEGMFERSTQEYTLTVKENTNDNVHNTTIDEQGYEIKEPLGTDEDGDYGYIVDLDNDNLIFTSYGEYNEFKYEDETGKEVNKVWLDGKLLEEGEDKDYISEPGSTRITINRQTLEGKVDESTHTIAIEFRLNGERSNELRRTAENFTIKVSKTDDSSSKPDDSSSKPDDSSSKPDDSSSKPDDSSSKPDDSSSKPDDSSSKPDDSSSKPDDSSSKPDDSSSKPDDSSSKPDDTPSNTDETTDTVNMIALLTDASGNPLSNYTIELHSKVQIKQTNANGFAKFSGAEISSHTFTIKDAAGVTMATKSFNIVNGQTLKLDGNTITAAKGSTFTLTLKLNGSSLTLASVQNGDKSGIKSSDDSTGGKSGGNGGSSGEKNTSSNGDRKAEGNSNNNDSTTQSPETGSTGNISLFIITLSVSGMLAFKKKNK